MNRQEVQLQQQVHVDVNTEKGSLVHRIFDQRPLHIGEGPALLSLLAVLLLDE